MFDSAHVPDWASDYVGWLYENYIVNGHSDTYFGANDVATLNQFCAVSGVYASLALKYYNAGTLESWTEESYYCAPVVEDIDADGRYEVVINTTNGAICVYDL